MKVIRFLFSLPFAALLLALGIAAGALYSVRTAYSEENVEKLLSSVQWAQLEIPDEDGITTLCDITNRTLASYKLHTLSEEEFNKIITESAADQLITDFAMDFSRWFFDSAERPVIDANKTVSVVVGVVDSFLSLDHSGDYDIPADYVQVITSFVEEMPDFKEAMGEFNHGLDQMEPYRKIVAPLTLYVLIAAVCIVILLLLLINRRSNSMGLTYIGFTTLLDGLAFFVLSRCMDFIPHELFTEYAIPESTLALAASPLLASFTTLGTVLAAGGGCVLVIAFAVSSARKARAER